MDCGYGSRWLLPCWQASHMPSLFEPLMKEILWRLSTRWTTLDAGCPNRWYHKEVEGLTAPRTLLFNVFTGYKPLLHGPVRRTLLVSCSFTQKWFGWNSKKMLLSLATRWTKRTSLFADGTWRMLFRCKFIVGEYRVLWQPAQENTVLSPKTDPLWSLSNSTVSSCCWSPG
jgi:hypothetical protein